MRYRVVGVLGRGATAVVELAIADDGTRVARKRVGLTGSALDIATARRRLRREAEILTGLHHPGIVPVLAVEDDGTDVVVVMPALVGLPDRVARQGPLPATAVHAEGRRLLGGLAAAHRSGVVHRDIKPANVLADHAGRLALADFGAASSREVTAGLTAAGTIVGTPRWVAPEQARGEPAGPAADVFSLAATLLWAATGYAPWGDGPSEVLLARAARGERAPLPDALDPGLRTWLAPMLDLRPESRPSAAAAIGGLDGTAAGVVGARWTPPARRRLAQVLVGHDGRPHRRRRRLGLVTAATTVTAAAAVAAIVVTGGGTQADEPGRSAAPAAGDAPHRACTALHYQPCGEPAAPHTDGSACLPGWYDLDGSPGDGCEARSDWAPGTTVTSGTTVRANIVPPSATDSFTVPVRGHVWSLCGGTLDLVLTAPAGVADRLEVLSGAATVSSATSADGTPATAAVRKPGCFGSHSETLTLRVRTVAGASGADFTITRSGGW